MSTKLISVNEDCYIGSGMVLKREYDGNTFCGEWVLRNDNGGLLGSSPHRHELAAEFHLNLERRDDNITKKRTVFLAWYHSGFFDSPSKLIAVCDSEAIAIRENALHKLHRDQGDEFKDEARWWVSENVVVCELRSHRSAEQQRGNTEASR